MIRVCYAYQVGENNNLGISSADFRDSDELTVDGIELSIRKYCKVPENAKVIILSWSKFIADSGKILL